MPSASPFRVERCRGCGARGRIGWGIQKRGISHTPRARLRRARQYWLGNPEARFRNLAAVARDRADILAACCDRLSGTAQERAALGRVRYLELASRLESRAELYGDRRASARVQRLQQLRRSGVYRGASAWDFTRGALVKDAMLGVALRPLLV